MKSLLTSLRVLFGGALFLSLCWLTITLVDAALQGENSHERNVGWGMAAGCALMALMVWKFLLYRGKSRDGASGFFGWMTEPHETPRKPGSALLTPRDGSRPSEPEKKRRAVVREIDRFEY
jgi:hypothetical protein